MNKNQSSNTFRQTQISALFDELCAWIRKGEWLWYGSGNDYQGKYAFSSDYDKSFKQDDYGRAEACRETALELERMAVPADPDQLRAFVESVRSLVGRCPMHGKMTGPVETLLNKMENGISAVSSPLSKSSKKTEDALTISPFHESDEPFVIHLWQTCGLTVPSNDPKKDIRRKLLVGREFFLVGKINGKIIATVMGGYEGHRGWLNYLAVHPDFQNQGFGKRMVSTVEKLLKKKGCPKINLQVRRSNRRVIAFYESSGYVEDDVISLGKRLIPD